METEQLSTSKHQGGAAGLSGIEPALLMAQVRNTAPWVFDLSADLPYVAILKQAALSPQPLSGMDQVAYFRLCLAAHHATVGTFVPTDVDNHIRFKLWPSRASGPALEAMTDVVLASLGWDNRPVSTRRVKSPRTGQEFSGHEGEWFSTAVAAYGAAMRIRNPDLAASVAECILAEMQRQADVFIDLRNARDGIGVLKASTLIAHNLGDLDRVIDLWKLPVEDPLRQAAYKVGHAEKVQGTWKTALAQAGEINKIHMAAENHRHFSLRAPRCLRSFPDLLLPLGPFFDDWGQHVAKHPRLQPEDVAEVVAALVDGWARLPGTVGYARALAGIIDGYRGGFNQLSKLLPARVARHLKSGPLRMLIDVPRRRFEEQWAAKVDLKNRILNWPEKS